MSRRIKNDFDAFNVFLSTYNLASYNSIPKQIESCKSMHKKLFSILIFVAEFKSQSINNNSVPYLDEVASDLLLSLFCVVQGMYKPAKLQLRCSIENFLKALVLINNSTITHEKNVYAIFDAAKQDCHFSTTYGAHCLDLIHNDYATLCRTVHGYLNELHPTSALSLLPQYNETLQNEVSCIYKRVVENCSGIFYLNYSEVIDQMHPENKKDFLDCLSKATKTSVIRTLYLD